MKKEEIKEKFGLDYVVDDNTFVMGTHHLLGDRIAERFKNFDAVLDTCSGAGFMSIYIAKYANKVITFGIDKSHIEQSRKNAKIAKLSSRINFLLGDILGSKIVSSLPKVDAAFLDPDWAKSGEHKKTHASSLSQMQPPADKLFYLVNGFTPNIALRLPKELNLDELNNLGPCEIEKIYLNKEFKFYCIYFGSLVRKIGISECRVFST